VQTLEDLVPGMVLEGVVTNVAAFGAFVDIGVHQDGLVHVSAMSRTFVSDPREVARPGDVVRVKVLSVDAARKRISLTLRLDDEPADRGRGARTPKASPQPGTASGRPASSGRPAGAARGRPSEASERGSGEGAMAEALRRAGLAGGHRDDRRPR
jgi:protein Tex